jgi:glycosyltransferase involved in cell wall biosynthesis
MAYIEFKDVSKLYSTGDVLVKALKLLKDRCVNYRAIITQEGELLPELKKLAAKHNLPIEFPGFLPMDELIRLYENCSVYVGSGKSEPWGMRLNDALNCGAPLIISRGMGGVKMVDDYKCGLYYSNNNAKDLADQLQRLAENKNLFLSVATKAYQAQEKISPECKARELFDVILCG